MTVRAYIAIILCKALRLVSRLLNRGGTAMPGRWALKVCPQLLQILAKDVKTVVVTGTNGKTTTTALLEHVLQSAGKTAKACGNYGYPLCEVALMEPQPEFAVLEVSSFQMETIADFRPEVAIWLRDSRSVPQR